MKASTGAPYSICAWSCPEEPKVKWTSPLPSALYAAATSLYSKSLHLLKTAIGKG